MNQLMNQSDVTWERFRDYWMIVFGTTERQARIRWLSINNKWRRDRTQAPTPTQRDQEINDITQR